MTLPNVIVKMVNMTRYVKPADSDIQRISRTFLISFVDDLLNEDLSHAERFKLYHIAAVHALCLIFLSQSQLTPRPEYTHSSIKWDKWV